MQDIPMMGSILDVDASILMGAFAGAMVFILSSHDFRILNRILLGGVSLIGGYISATSLVDFAGSFIPHKSEISPSVGALFSSAGIVRVLIFFSRNGLSFILHKKEKDE